MESESIARFLESVADACRALATDLRTPVKPPITDVGVAPTQSLTLTQSLLVNGIRLGMREREVLQLFERKGYDARLTASEVADGLGGYDKANVYFPLRTLTKKGVLDELQGPVLRWQLGGDEAAA